MTTIFFHGLFMDRTLLVEKGLRPKPVGSAVLPGYRIHIGDRVVAAECYTLPPGSGLTGANPACAKELSRLVDGLGFDPVYVREIAAFGEQR